MALGHVWAGRAEGTNGGKLFVKLEGDDSSLSGTLRFNDDRTGIVAYTVRGQFDGQALLLKGTPVTEQEGIAYGNLVAKAQLSPRGDLVGEWETDIGSAGTFFLSSLDAPQHAPQAERSSRQLYSARADFGAVDIDLPELIALADKIQGYFPSNPLIVTVVAGTEQRRYLQDFKTLNFPVERSEAARLFVQQPEPSGTMKTVTVEFGQQANWAMTQSEDEAWVLGMLERLKRDIHKHERRYATNFRRYGFGINQVFVLAAAVFLPSLELMDRIYLIAASLSLTFGINWAHQHYLPLAAIHLRRRPESRIVRYAASVASWVITIVAAVVQAVLIAYLLGLLKISEALPT